MSVLDERPILRVRDPKYRMNLSIYPVATCGDDLQKGKPLEVSSEDTDLYELKRRIEWLILSAVSKKHEGKCFVEMVIEKDGRYYDQDEQWVVVDPLNKTIKYEGM